MDSADLQPGAGNTSVDFELEELEDEDPIDVNDYIDAASEESERCGICLDLIIDRGVLDCCSHWFCFACIDNWATITNLCPLCKSEFQLITCLPVYDPLGNLIVDKNIYSNSRDDEDWIIQERNSALSFPSYYISEDAVKCLDGDGCKMRSNLSMPSSDDGLILDTSIACDSCDVWYHAFCVGFDPQDQPGNSWLCPRCAIDEMPQKREPKIVHAGPPVESTFSSKVSISVADEGETAVVISMIEEQQSNVFIGKLESVNQAEVSQDNDHEGAFPDCEANTVKVDFPENDITDSQLLYDGSLQITEPNSSHHVTEICDKSEDPMDTPKESECRIKAPASVLSLSKAVTGQDSVEHKFFDSDCQVSPTILFQTEKHVLDASAISYSPGVTIIDFASNNDGDCSSKKAHIELKSMARSGTNEQSLKRMRDPNCKLSNEIYLKKAKLDKMSQKQQPSTSSNDYAGHIKEAVCMDDKMPRTFRKDSMAPEIMSIVKEVRNKPISLTIAQSPADKTTRSDGTTGLRVKKIMHRAGENAESSDVLQRLRQQIKDAVCVDPCKEFMKDDTSDNKLLAAFRAAIVRPKTEASKKSNPLISPITKLIAKRGKVRENLTKKIYKTNGRLRRAWDRDLQIDFWKHRCFTCKPKKAEALQSVLDILKGITSPSNANRLELNRNAEDSILSRIYLADSSVFPRKEDIKCLSDISGSSINSDNGPCKEHQSNSSLRNDYQLKSVKSQESTSTSLHAIPNMHAKKEVTLFKDKKEHSNDLKSGEPTSNSAPNGSKESLQSLDKEDRRKWALEFLARKNAITDRGKDHEKQEDHTLMKGNFPLLAQLPVEMRPVVAPIRNSKIPLSTRQAQLYRLTEFYLRRANPPVVHRSAATELAVADAVNVEKEILARSNSKLVYVNLCSQHVLNSLSQKTKRTDAEQSSVHHENVQQVNECDESDSLDISDFTEALKLTGLVSDSPPSSPRSSGSGINTRNDNSENVLGIDCNANSQPDESDSKTERLVVTTNSEKSIQALEEVPDCDKQQRNCSLNNLIMAEAHSDMPIMLKDEGSAQDTSLKAETGGSSNALDLVGKENGAEMACAGFEELYGPEKKHFEENCNGSEKVVAEGTSLKTEAGGTSNALNLVGKENDEEMASALFEELYGPEKKQLKENFNGDDKVIAQNDLPCEDDNDKSKNGSLISNIPSVNISKSEVSEEEALASHSLSKEVVPGEEKLTTSNQEPTGDSVSRKVEAYIKEHIRPLCKSGIITVEQYRWVVGKTRDKVMKYHCHAKNASFLIKEGDKVKKLAQQYAEAASKQQAIGK